MKPHTPSIKFWRFNPSQSVKPTALSSRSAIQPAVTALLLIVVSVTGPTWAATETWDGGHSSSNFWFANINWLDNTAPVDFDDLVFAGTTRLSHSSYGNLGGADGDFDMNSITFDAAAGAFVISNGGGGTHKLHGTIANNSTNLQTLNFPFQLTGNRTIDLANGDITIGGVISQDGSNRGFTQIGTGTLTLNGANTYAGTTGIGITNGATAGTVIVTNNSALGTGTVSFGAGGTLVLGIDGLTIGNFVFVPNRADTVPRTIQLDLAGTNTGTMTNTIDMREGGNLFVIDVGDSDTLTVSGSVNTGAGGGAGITKTGTGTLILTNSSHTVSGAFKIQEGTLQVGNGGTTGALNTGANSDIVISAGATLAINQSDTVTQGTEFNSDPITGDGSFEQNGTGTTILNVANTYAGTTTVNAGVLQMGNNSALGSGGLVTTVNSGAALNLNGADNINEDISIVGVGPGVDGALYNNATNTASISGSRTLTLTGDATIGGARRIDISATITDNGSDYTLTKIGSTTGGINLWTTNLDVANLDIQAATVIIKDLPRDTLTVRSGATAIAWQLTDWGTGDIVLESGATIQTNRNVFTTAANISISGTATLRGSNNNSGVTPDQATYSGDITGTGGLTILDYTENQNFKFILSGSNSYSGGTTVGNSSRAVALLAGSTTGLSSNSAFNVTTNATLKLNGNNNTIASLTGAGAVENDNASAATLTAGDASDTTFSGALQDGAGGGALSLIKTGAGTLILEDAQTYTGTTTVNAGTLQLLGTSGSINLTSTYQINNGSTLYLNDTTANHFLVGGSDDFTFGSNGGGTFSLNGNILWRTATIATTGGARNFVSGGAFNHQNTHSIIFDSGVGTDVDGIDLEVSTRVERGSIVKNGAGYRVADQRQQQTAGIQQHHHQRRHPGSGLCWPDRHLWWRKWRLVRPAHPQQRRCLQAQQQQCSNPQRGGFRNRIGGENQWHSSARARWYQHLQRNDHAGRRGGHI